MTPNEHERHLEDELPTMPSETEHVEDLAEDVQEVATAPVTTGTSKFSSFTAWARAKWQRFKEFVVECKRVLRVTKKPDKEELKVIVKVSGVGMAIIGALGFLVHFVKELL